MYNNCLPQHQELEDVFTQSEILYLIEHKHKQNRSNDASDQKQNYVDIMDTIKNTVEQYHQTESVDHDHLKEICLNLWFYCMGWNTYKKGDDLLQSIDQNCNKIYILMTQNYSINSLMILLKICLIQHKKSIDSLLEESQGIMVFNDIYLKDTDNDKIKSFWKTFSILSIYMNSILCIAWTQRNNPKIFNNALFIEEFHIDKEPLFVHLMNYIAMDNYSQTMPIKKFLIYIRWHLFFSDNTAHKLNDIIKNINKNKSIKKCAVHDFFSVANRIDHNHTPLLVLPPSINQYGINNKDKKDDDMNEKIEFKRPSHLDYKYPIHKLPIKYQFEALNPRIELFGKDILPKELLDLFEECYNHLPNRRVNKYNMYCCDLYRYLALKARVPDWILMKQNKDNILNKNKKDSSPKWLQNIRMGLAIKKLIKLLCSTMPSSYKMEVESDRINCRITNVPDIRYEIAASIFSDDLKHFMIELRRHQNILIFNIIGLLLGLMKLFKTHEILQFEYLKHLIHKDNGIIVLCKVFNHPWFDVEQTVFITKPQTFIECKDKEELMNAIYNNDDDYGDVSSRIITMKTNALRIIQKCIKYSFGYCGILCNVLKCDKWMVKYVSSKHEIMRYYVLKIYKSMMPFLDKELYKDIIELIKNNIRIGINDEWLSLKIKNDVNDAIKRYKEKEETSSNILLNDYYQWLALKEPTETDYAETCFNPFYVENNYGKPKLSIIAPKQWIQIIDNACNEYHEWLFQQMKCDDTEFAKQEKYIGSTIKEMEQQKMIERSNKVDKGLADIKIPNDFDFEAYLRAYFKGNQDELLEKI